MESLSIGMTISDNVTKIESVSLHISDKFFSTLGSPTERSFLVLSFLSVSVSAFLFPFQSLSFYMSPSLSVSLLNIHIHINCQRQLCNYLQQSNCLQIVSYFSVCIMSNCSTLLSLFIGLTMTRKKSEIKLKFTHLPANL